MTKGMNDIANDCADFISFANRLKSVTEIKMLKKLTESECDAVLSYALMMWKMKDATNAFALAKMAREFER